MIVEACFLGANAIVPRLLPHGRPRLGGQRRGSGRIRCAQGWARVPSSLHQLPFDERLQLAIFPKPQTSGFLPESRVIPFIIGLCCSYVYSEF